jgi:NAD(P)-dependent dehydrogenase (short-subunit alcohol dehydrogenase family)
MIFAGKVALITGSTTGIGEACAQVFAESGAKVMVSGRHEQRGCAVVEAIRAKGGDAQFAAVRHMKSAGKGAIVNVASEWGLNGEANHVAYCASKGAVIQITRCMALDHARDNIRVNSVCPGEIHTRMVDDILAKRGGDPADNLRELAAGIPMRRLAHPTEVARCVHFLASDLASYVTGTNLSVDGGNDATAGPYP